MRVFWFYILAFVYSWGVWILGILFSKDSFSPNLLVSIGGLGPVVSLIFYLIFLCNMKKRREYLKRLFEIKGISINYWIMLAVIPFLITVLPAIIDGIISNKETLRILVLDTEFLKSGWVYALFLLIFGPIPEEMAWRGVAFNELLQKGYLKAQLLVALLWSLWHVPLFFIVGSYQNKLGIFTLDFWLFFVNVIFISFITGWIYIKCKKSILAVIIFHYLINLTGEMLYLSKEVNLLKIIIICILGVIFLIKPSIFVKVKE